MDVMRVRKDVFTGDMGLRGEPNSDLGELGIWSRTDFLQHIHLMTIKTGLLSKHLINER
jgi:hypothetical protein